MTKLARLSNKQLTLNKTGEQAYQRLVAVSYQIWQQKVLRTIKEYRQLLQYNLFIFEKFVINETVFDLSLNEYLQWKTNSLPGSNIQYLITICIVSIRIRPNSLWQTKYRQLLQYNISSSHSKDILSENVTGARSPTACQ